jgi:hypothetical protein
VRIVIRNAAPWDGAYDIGDFDGFTVREWGWLKRLAGIHPTTLMDALRNYDAELIAVLAVIGLYHAGRINQDDAARVFERFGDGPLASSFDLDFSDEDDDHTEDDAGPPAISSSSRSSGSGDDSQMSSGTSPTPLNGSGSPASATSPSAPVTWGT